MWAATVPEPMCCMRGGHDPSERKKLGDNHYYHPRTKTRLLQQDTPRPKAKKGVRKNAT